VRRIRKKYSMAESTVEQVHCYLWSSSQILLTHGMHFLKKYWFTVSIDCFVKFPPFFPLMLRWFGSLSTNLAHLMGQRDSYFCPSYNCSLLEPSFSQAIISDTYCLEEATHLTLKQFSLLGYHMISNTSLSIPFTACFYEPS
jgi:hypothetical protein